MCRDLILTRSQKSAKANPRENRHAAGALTAAMSRKACAGYLVPRRSRSADDQGCALEGVIFAPSSPLSPTPEALPHHQLRLTEPSDHEPSETMSRNKHVFHCFSYFVTAESHWPKTFHRKRETALISREHQEMSLAKEMQNKRRVCHFKSPLSAKLVNPDKG